MEVVWLANHNAHTYFGLQVLGQLPPDLPRTLHRGSAGVPPGPLWSGPLIFSLWTKKISDRLHKRWREESLPDLTDAIQTGSPTARSFAAGYILHHMLDDTVHPVIYGWMEEGSSHFRLEIALDLLLLEEKRRANSPKLHTEGKGRTAATAESVLKPMGARQYLAGLWRMAALSNCFCGPGRPATGGIRAREKVQARDFGSGGGADCPGRPSWREFWYGRQVDKGKKNHAGSGGQTRTGVIFFPWKGGAIPLRGAHGQAQLAEEGFPPGKRWLARRGRGDLGHQF